MNEPIAPEKALTAPPTNGLIMGVPIPLAYGLGMGVQITLIINI